jgi:deoxyribonuclease IV
MDAHRVRSLIPYANYGEFTRKKLLPKTKLFTQIPIGGKFPSWVRSFGYSEYGIFMERVIQTILTTPHLLKPIVIGHLPAKFQPKLDIDFYKPFATTLTQQFPDAKLLEFEPEWQYEQIVGHPDLVYGNIVCDVKTTGRFSAMRTDTIFQLLCYYCLAQLLFPDRIDSIGLILPAQNQIIVYNLAKMKWDWVSYWSEFAGSVTLKMNRMSLYPLDKMIMYEMLKYGVLGSHVHKQNLLEYGEKYIEPMQFFLDGRCSSDFSIDAKFSNRLKSITKRRQRLFIHAPYTLNLSNADDWVAEKTINHLEFAAEHGIDGVVVHCGKRGKLSWSQAIVNMYFNVKVIAAAVKNTKLIIETSSGQDGELLCDPHELCNFVLSHSATSRSKITLCVDTCHVFAAGYEPMSYIKTIESYGIPISLIHYNDSKMPQGSKRDRHAAVGDGYIGIDSLLHVLLWAREKNVPCVTE